jgi:hypothetical protein
LCRSGTNGIPRSPSHSVAIHGIGGGPGQKAYGSPFGPHHGSSERTALLAVPEFRSSLPRPLAAARIRELVFGAPPFGVIHLVHGNLVSRLESKACAMETQRFERNAQATRITIQHGSGSDHTGDLLHGTASTGSRSFKNDQGRTPANGSLVWTKGWAERITTSIDGERVRIQRQLATTRKVAAQAKLARLIASTAPTAEEARRPETFEDASRRIVAVQAHEGLASWKDGLARLERYAFPAFGSVPVTEVRPNHIRSAIDTAFSVGWANGTTRKLLVDCSTILGELWRDELITENPAARVRVPKGAPVNERERIVLSDAEFEIFMACPAIDAELHTMSFTSRTVGGMSQRPRQESNLRPTL